MACRRVGQAAGRLQCAANVDGDEALRLRSERLENVTLDRTGKVLVYAAYVMCASALRQQRKTFGEALIIQPVTKIHQIVTKANKLRAWIGSERGQDKRLDVALCIVDKRRHAWQPAARQVALRVVAADREPHVPRIVSQMLF